MTEKLVSSELTPAILIDCSHGNSNKDYKRQAEVFDEVLEQAANPDSSVFGAMLESNLNAGSQAFPQPIIKLKKGVSITDACIDWETTENILQKAYARLDKVKAH